MYTIGQVSERFDLPVSTLRYYDKEGLFPNLTRTSGARRFGEQELEALLRELRRTNPGVEKSIFHSIHSVCLDTMVGYKTGGVEHTFADCYRERGEMTQEDET